MFYKRIQGGGNDFTTLYCRKKREKKIIKYGRGDIYVSSVKNMIVKLWQS